MKKQRTERGQAIVLIALAIVGLVGLTGLSVDMGVTYANRRQSQNAADNAALSTALLAIRDEGATQAELEANANNIIRANGLDPDEAGITVTINRPPQSPSSYSDCSSTDYDCNEYIQVTIESETQTFFAPVIGVNSTSSTVAATAHAKPPEKIVPFNGAAVVGLAPNGNSFEAKSASTTWHISGGGIFGNYNAVRHKNGAVDITGGCVTAVNSTYTGGWTGPFSCTPTVSGAPAYAYPDDVIPLLPPIPSCNGTATVSGGIVSPEAGKDGSVVAFIDGAHYDPGLYCINNAGGNFHSIMTGTDVTFYIMDDSFTMKFNGGGSMSLQAPTSGTYKGMLMFSGITASPCTQNIQYRGNGGAENIGTVFLPSACIDGRSNSEAHNIRSQIIGYRVTSNGTGDLYVAFSPDDNYKPAVPPQIELAE